MSHLVLRGYMPVSCGPHVPLSWMQRACSNANDYDWLSRLCEERLYDARFSKVKLVLYSLQITLMTIALLINHFFPRALEEIGHIPSKFCKEIKSDVLGLGKPSLREKKKVYYILLSCLMGEIMYVPRCSKVKRLLQSFQINRSDLFPRPVTFHVYHL